MKTNNTSSSRLGLFWAWPTLLLLATFLTLFPLPAGATTMSPTRYEIAGDAGKTTEAVIKIYNDEKIKRTYYLSAAKFETQGETGDPVFVPEKEDGLVKWFEFPSSVEVGGQQYKEVTVKINVPAGATAGGYFAAVFASVVPPVNNDPNAVSIQSDVGTLVLFRVNGDIPTNDSILEFATKDKKKWHVNLPIEFFFRFQNSGEDRAQPLGDITIKNFFGRTTKIVTANKGAGNVLPESIRRFDSAWVTSGGNKIEQVYGQISQPQLDSFWANVQYQWNNFALGRYKAEINLTVNNDASRTHDAKYAFWVIPWHLLLLVFGSALVFFGFLLVTLLIIVLLILRHRDKDRSKNSNRKS